MNSLKPYLLIAAFIALAVIYWQGCERKPDHIPDAGKMVPAEPVRQRVVETDTTERAKYRKLAAERLTQIEALQRTIIAETGKRKQAEQKARESAAAYAKNPSLHTCHTALTDCQYENETKAYSLAVQERMISEYDSLQKIQVSEIGRQNSVIDTLAEGWRIANVSNSDLTEQLRKQKSNRWGVGFSGGYGASKQGISPYIGVSVNYNFIRF